jgi:type II restriction enzyme
MEFNSVVQDVIVSTNWKSKSRIIGEAGEIYIKNNLQCQRCNIQDFDKCKTNEPSKDLVCNNCGQRYQIKAANSKTKKNDDNSMKIMGGEYSTTINNINQEIDYLIIIYENNTNTYKIKNIYYIKKENITTNCIVPRKPLSQNAKRAGWQGCYIMLKNIIIL